ncbi:MAG: SHOCT domain-containing protein [Actinobacteria bacterium]|nr:SHOCT domain-containing protein [Actinomycetota bacterium]
MVLGVIWGVGQVLLSLLWFFLFFIWIWLLITVFADIFRSRELSGVAKALWILFVIVFPYLGVLVYLIARGDRIHEHAVEHAAEQESWLRRYVQDVAGSSSSPAGELERLASLRDRGVIDETEFQRLKTRIVG